MQHEDDYGRWVNQLSHRIKRRMDARLASMGITGAQGRMLHYILDQSQAHPVFQKDVEEVFGLRRSTATGILQLLEKGGLISREPVPYDARLKSLVPTEKAAAIHEEMRACIHETEQILARGIDPDALQTFLQVIRQMTDNLDS